MGFLKNITVVTIACLAVFSAQAQSVLDSPIDGVVKREAVQSRKPIPYAPLREADLMWQKRVWRTIDLREKINLPLYYPFEKTNGMRSLAEVLFSAVVDEGTIKPWSNTRDDFSVDMTVTDVLKITNKTKEITGKSFLDPDIDSVIIVTEKFEARKVKRYEIKEEWFFDRQRSVLDVRILGICPIYEVDKEGAKIYIPLFWVYFPHAREVLAKNDVFNRNNSSERRTFDDIFWKRQFNSYIHKEENVYDRDISEYKKGMDALLEAQRIKDQIILFEHDLWEF
jgi:gliding motility associated protien GldN